MTNDEIVVAVIDALNELGVPYMLTGSLASNVWGIARSTADADFVVQSRSLDLRALAERLGPDFRLDPQVSFETVTGTNRHVVRARGRRFRVELFLLSNDPHDVARFGRRQPVRVLGHEMYLPTAEDVVISKLRWSQQGKRAKDLADARNVIAVQGDRLDWDYLRDWCRRQGTEALLDDARRSIPPL